MSNTEICSKVIQQFTMRHSKGSAIGQTTCAKSLALLQHRHAPQYGSPHRRSREADSRTRCCPAADFASWDTSEWRLALGRPPLRTVLWILDYYGVQRGIRPVARACPPVVQIRHLRVERGAALDASRLCTRAFRTRPFGRNDRKRLSVAFRTVRGHVGSLEGAQILWRMTFGGGIVRNLINVEMPQVVRGVTRMP